MVLSTSSATGLMEGISPWSGLQHQLFGVLIGLPCMWLAAKCSPSRFRAAAYPLMFVSLLGLIVSWSPAAGVTSGGAARWIQLGRHPVPAVRAGQVRLPAVGGRPAGPQGEARPAGRLAAAAHPAPARGRDPRPAGDAGRRPGHHVRPADHLPGAAVDHRHPGPVFLGHAGHHRPGAADHDRRRALPAEAADRLPGPGGQPGRPEPAEHPGQMGGGLGWLVRRGPGRQPGEMGLGPGIDDRLHLRDPRARNWA